MTVGVILLSVSLLVGCQSDHGQCEAIGNGQALCDNNSDNPADSTVEDYDDVDVN